MKVQVCGMKKKSLDEAVKQLHGFVENRKVHREILLLLTDAREIEPFARSRSVTISTDSTSQNPLFPIKYTFSGGEFDVQLVEDHLRNSISLIRRTADIFK